MNAGFEDWIKNNPEKFKEIQRDIMIDVYKIEVGKNIPLNFGGDKKLGKILTEPDLELIFSVRIPNGINKTQVVDVKAVDFEDDIFLGVEVIQL